MKSPLLQHVPLPITSNLCPPPQSQAMPSTINTIIFQETLQQLVWQRCHVAQHCFWRCQLQQLPGSSRGDGGHCMVQVIVDVISNVPGIIFWWQNARQLDVGAKCRTSFSSLNWSWQDNLTICRAHLGRRLPKLNWSRNTSNSNSMQQPRTSAQKQRCQSSQFNNSRTTWISSCYPLNHPISTSKPCPNQGNKLQTYPQTRLPGCHINICRRLLMKVLGAVWSWKMELDLQDWFFPHIQQL